MINKYFLCFFMAIVFKVTWSQSIGQLTITPHNPTPTDTIYITSKLTYSGACSYGLVYTYTTVTGNTLAIMPTYCGYGSSTTCTSIDTFKIPPLALGNYVLKIEYHQGSVCPISGFDATIGETDTILNIKTPVTTSIMATSGLEAGIRIYPNPAKENVTIETLNFDNSPTLIIIRNVLGESVICKKKETQLMTLNLAGLPSGVYTLELENSSGIVSKQRFLLQ